jgi:hypothetical protein
MIKTLLPAHIPLLPLSAGSAHTSITVLPADYKGVFYRKQPDERYPRPGSCKGKAAGHHWLAADGVVCSPCSLGVPVNLCWPTNFSREFVLKTIVFP